MVCHNCCGRWKHADEWIFNWRVKLADRRLNSGPTLVQNRDRVWHSVTSSGGWRTYSPGRLLFFKSSHTHLAQPAALSVTLLTYFGVASIRINLFNSLPAETIWLRYDSHLRFPLTESLYDSWQCVYLKSIILWTIEWVWVHKICYIVSMHKRYLKNCDFTRANNWNKMYFSSL